MGRKILEKFCPALTVAPIHVSFVGLSHVSVPHNHPADGINIQLCKLIFVVIPSFISFHMLIDFHNIHLLD